MASDVYVGVYILWWGQRVGGNVHLCWLEGDCQFYPQRCWPKHKTVYVTCQGMFLIAGAAWACGAYTALSFAVCARVSSVQARHALPVVPSASHNAHSV
jgi:hypothetical protein